jgi:ABC-type glycerol-3-phosphate transport system permease component
MGSTPSRQAFVTIAAWVVGIAFILPLVWMLTGSFRDKGELFASVYPLSWGILVPETLTLENYENLFAGPFGRSVFNSIFVTAVSVIVGLILSAMAAFALAKIPFRGAGVLFVAIVLSFLVPFDAIAVPLANIFREWGLANTYAGLILPGVANGLAVFALRQFFLGVPDELAEAARMDGLSWWGIFWRIYLPLSRPALIGAGFILFLFHWSAYLWPMLIATKSSVMLGPIALSTLATQQSVDFGAIFAGAVFLTLVPLILLLVFQKHFTASLASTGSKG